jgi:hypothetical protein
MDNVQKVCHFKFVADCSVGKLSILFLMLL